MASSRPRGYLFILNVQKGRCGAQFDTPLMRKTFEAMGVEVEEKIDPTGRDVRNIMKEIYAKDFTNYLFCAVAYFSHGGEDDIVTTITDKELINLQKTILIPLGNIKSLDGKLKWLILQNCRGSYDFVQEKPEGPEPIIKYPLYYAKFFATSPGMRAYRTGNGSCFLKALCKRLEMEYMDLDIMAILDNTIRDLAEEFNNNEEWSILQKPQAETNLKGRKFFITSGFKDD